MKRKIEIFLILDNGYIQYIKYFYNYFSFLENKIIIDNKTIELNSTNIKYFFIFINGILKYKNLRRKLEILKPGDKAFGYIGCTTDNLKLICKKI